MTPTESPQPEPAEKRFYLEAFRARAIVLHVAHASDVGAVVQVAEELASHGALVVTVAPGKVRRRGAIALPSRALDSSSDALAALFARLISEGISHVVRPLGLGGRAALEYSGTLAVRLGAAKLVVVDPRGGFRSRQGNRSFVTVTGLGRLGSQALGSWRPGELAVLVETLRRGVESVNLTDAERLASELFTYEGAGTLLTGREYCAVGALRVDQLEEAARLMARGEREGFLLPRTDEQRVRLLLGGYGAWFGGGRLAGVCALETDAYRRERLGEVAGFYTITRFKGQGVGVRIVRHLASVGRERGLRALFACTSSERAAEFFARNRFREVAPEAIPRRKWRERRRLIGPPVAGRPEPRVFLRELPGPGA